jgi:hypothetical protein
MGLHPRRKACWEAYCACNLDAGNFARRRPFSPEPWSGASYNHDSFFFWIILFLPFFIIFRLKSVPYFVAVVQHFAFGDFLIGTRVMIFWPFNSSFVGFNFGMASPMDVALETAGLVLTLVIMVYIGDLKRLFSVDKSNIFMLLPSLALLASASALFFAFHRSSTNSFASYLSSGNLLIVLIIGHLVLFAFLAVSTLQGLRAFRTKENRTKNARIGF